MEQSPDARGLDTQALDTQTLVTRLEPWRALRCLLAVGRDPERTDVGAEMVRALEGRSRQRLIERLAAHPVGARVLAQGRRLDRTLADRAALAALPPGSLGERYAAWTRDEGIGVESLIEASGFAGPAPVGPTRLLELRDACSHDLWHLLTGYGRDLLGETALLHFTQVQTRNTGLLLPGWAGLLAPAMGREGRRLVLDARRRARRASWLPGADWEALLSEPLVDVRAGLGLGPPPRYTPVWREALPPSPGAEATAGRA